MSEAEFDSYLSLLSKFLRLRSRQRADLADELRDHLDSRLDELLTQGKSREQAIRIALEEFGDAAVLAEDFSRLASRRKRRFVMRCTAASAAVVAAVVLLSLAFAPPGPNGPGPQNLVAQQPVDEQLTAGESASSKPADGAAAHASEGSIEQKAIAELDQKLSQVLPEVHFTDTPLSTVLDFIGSEINADTLVDRQGLEEEGLTIDTTVTLSLSRTQVSARTVLDFVLQPLNLTFVNRAGVIYVTTETRAEEHLTTKVYNVRDLLENAESHYTPAGGFGLGGGGFGGGGMGGGGLGGGGLGGTGGGGFFSVLDAAATGVILSSTSQLDEGGQGGFGMGMGAIQNQDPVPVGAAADLIRAIEEATSGFWFDRDGSGGSLSLFNGLLVVRQTDEVHAQVQKLLDALRQAGDGQPGKSVTVPKEGETSTRNTISESPLGLTTSPLSDEDWHRLNQRLSTRREPTKEARVVQVKPGSKAEKAGLRKGDVIIAVNVEGSSDPGVPASIADAVSRHAMSFTLSIVRQEKEKLRSFEVTIQGTDS